jgi:hypothetical protein
MHGLCEVFIAYGHADRAVADRLYELLRTRRVSAWYDAFIPAGNDWRDAIVAHLSQAQVMVILLSAAALQSDELKKELAVADQENVPLLAARLENVKPGGAFAYELARGNWFEVFTDPDARLGELADLLGRLVRDHTQIPRTLEASVRAREERRRRESWGYLAHLRRPSVLAALSGALSLVAFWLYEWRTSPVEQLVAGGLDPLTAYLYVTVAVTVASPVLAISLLRGGLQLDDIPLMTVALLNAAAIIGLVYAVVRDLRLHLHRVLRR